LVIHGEDMLDTYEQNSKKKLAATIVAVIIIAGVVVFADMLKSKSSTAATATTQPPTQSVASDSSSANTTAATDTTSSSTTSSGSFKDGTYSATSSYFVPNGNESIKVTVTLSSDKITDVSIVNSASDHDSAAYQADFTDSYKTYVVGKKISGLQIKSVAGASDTTQGFNEALNQIASEAQA